VAGSGPLTQADVRPCVTRSDRQRSGAPGLPAAAPSRAIGNRVFDGTASCRRHKWGLPARDGSRLGRGSRLGWRHGLGWGHGLGWHRFRQLFPSLALRTHLHRYPFIMDSAMAGPRPLGADRVRFGGLMLAGSWSVHDSVRRLQPPACNSTTRAWISGPINPTDGKSRRCPDRAGSAPCRLCRRRRGR
jgi:hypothetical protein